jgi:fatty acid-binding protein DegV
LASFENLVRNGRMSRAAGMIATALHIRAVSAATREGEIEVLEKEKMELVQLMDSGMLDAKQLQEKSERYGQLLDLLSEKEMRWLELSELEG